MHKLTKTLPPPTTPAFIVLLLLPLAASAGPVLELSKRVDDPTPMQNESFEFSIEVANVGDETALEVHVDDRLPPELVLAPGMAAFPGSGSYDPDTGDWSVGDLAPGSGSTLTVPAMLAVADPPACIVNIASATFAGDAADGKATARAAIRETGTEHCVDLEPDFSIGVGNVIFPECDHSDRYYGTVTVTNHGPDAARRVVVTISQDPVVGPNLRFDDADCVNAAAPFCSIGTVASGDSVVLDITSDLFQSYESFTQTISVLVATMDVDYEPSNDNPSSDDTAGGFSNCDAFNVGDIPLPFAAGPACFIATAAWGSALDPHVDTLREFRDRYLMTNRWGRAFVAFYYRHSQPLADFIALRPWLRTFVRWLLTPLVLAIAVPGAATGLLGVAGLTSAVLLVRYRRRRFNARKTRAAERVTAVRPSVWGTRAAACRRNFCALSPARGIVRGCRLFKQIFATAVNTGKNRL